MYACIPALNEEWSIGQVLLLTGKYVDQIFVCDDGSVDRTGNLAESFGAFVLHHETNIGKGASLRDLFNEALKGSPDVVVTLDGDNQHDPRYIPDLLKPILSGSADMVIGSRYMVGSKMDAPLYRRIGLKFFNWNWGHSEVKDVQSGFRAYSVEALTTVNFAKAKGYGVEIEQLRIAEKKGLRIVEVPIEVSYHVKRPSKKHPLVQGIDLISTLIRIASEEQPLLLLGLPGTFFFVLGTISGVMLIITWNDTRYFSLPLAMLMLIGVFFGGMLGATSIILNAIGKLKSKL